MSEPRRSGVQWFYTHNPFYAISALLMLYGVRAGYGELEIGTINCWIMMGVLAAYTLVLAAVGVLLVRWGGVWDDARSILLLLLLLLLAVSISADDLFVKMASRRGGSALLTCGFLFSIAVAAGVLRGTGIRLGAAYQVPFVLLMALFYVMPWWCSPELHPRGSPALNWTVLLFPQAAALLGLTLLPAARRGPEYVANSGTPWPWPWFPWTAFGVIAGAVALRSYALAMTFSQTGQIWVSKLSREGIVFDTIWRPYFLVPFGLVVIVLVLEAALTVHNHRLVRQVLLTAPALLLFAWPWADSPVSRSFLRQVTATIGSPVWLTAWMLLAFNVWALLRKVSGAELGVLANVALLAVVGSNTLSLGTLAPSHPVVLFVLGGVLAALGLRGRSSALCLSAAAATAVGLWLVIPGTPLGRFRTTLCFHVLMPSCVLLSVLMRDRFSILLQGASAMLLPLTSVIVLTNPRAAEIPLVWRLLYVAALVVVCLVCVRACRSWAYWTGTAGTSAVLAYGVMVLGFRSGVAAVGSRSMTAFAWSLGTLLLGMLISAYKANWLPRMALPPWLENLGTLASRERKLVHANQRERAGAGEAVEPIAQTEGGTG